MIYEVVKAIVRWQDIGIFAAASIVHLQTRSDLSADVGFGGPGVKFGRQFVPYGGFAERIEQKVGRDVAAGCR